MNFKSVLTLTLVILLGFLLYQNNQLNKRLGLVENRLGGKAVLACNDKDTIEKVRKSVVRVVGGLGEGSGFAVKENLILTNFHVIEFEPSPRILFPDNSFENGTIIMADKVADLALIQTNKKLTPLPLGNSKELQPADELLAIGYPFGETLVGESTVNKGSLSGRRHFKEANIDFIQTDTTLNPGVSGGPMVNICGEVQGINTAGTGGLGLAISSESIKQKWLDMAINKDSLKDIKQIVFEPEKGPLEAVTAFYNYIKVRKMHEAFGLMSDHLKAGYEYDQWIKGYQPNLDTSVISIIKDKDDETFVKIKLSTKDLIEDEIVSKYFEGTWEVREINGKWQLWDPEIKEVIDPPYSWFFE